LLDTHPHDGAQQVEVRERMTETPRRAAKVRWIAPVAAALAIIVAGAGIMARRQQEKEVAQWTAEQAIPTVATVKPKQGVSGQQIVLPGDIEAWYEAPIYARVNGYLKNWYFDFGAHVQKGQLLAEIDAPDLDAQLAAAKAKLLSAEAQVKVRASERDFANTTYARWRDSPKGVVSEQETEAKRADYESAVARYNAALADVNADQSVVDQLTALEAFKRILAPFDGIVTTRNTDIGALINAGSSSNNGPQLFRVADVHQMRVFVQVPQELSARVRRGLAADLIVPQYPDRTFKADVATTAEAINKTSRTLLVELHADNPDGLLQSGTFAEVHFHLPSNPDTIRIPTSALVFREDGMQVAIIGPDDKVELKPVKLGRNLGTEVEILTGLTMADTLINSPPDSLETGDLVKRAPQAQPQSQPQTSR